VRGARLGGLMHDATDTLARRIQERKD